MVETAVIGREEELAEIRAFLAEAEEGPSTLLLSGEPGIGKTILWEQGVEEARARFAHVLTCRAVEPEAPLSFASLSELVGPVLGEVAPALAVPRRRALEVALLLAEPVEEPPDVHAIGLALLDVLAALAEREPALVALDDAQWVDPASAAVLQVALRRLRAERVGLLATLRVAPEVVSPLQLEGTLPEGRLRRLSLGPLSAGAVYGVLKQRLGLELTRPQLARVQEATAGNPFFALALGRELVRTSTRPGPGQALRVPETLRELLGDGLARLPSDTLDVLLQVAALARPTIDLIVRAQGGGERVQQALEAAVRAGVVELEEARVRFAHPLLASICYEQAPLWERRAAHRALAAVVDDAEERARHLALAAEGPDAAVASELDSAAEQAAARGATAAAAELCELAAALTPADPVADRRRRLRAARLHRLAGDLEHASALLEQLRAEVPPGVERADVLFELASTFWGGVPGTIGLCDEALAEAADDDARSARILAHRSVVRLSRADVGAALADARAALAKAENVGDPTLLAVAIARVGQAESWAGEVTPGLLERGARIEQRLGLRLEGLDSPRTMLARLLIRLGEPDRARAILEEQEAEAAARGYDGTRVFVTWYLSMLEWSAGRWQRALDHAAAAAELTERIRFSTSAPLVGRVRGLVEADLGLVDEARASAEEGLALSRTSSNEAFSVLSLGTLGRLELALGNLEAAGEHLRELPGSLLAAGLNDPTLPVWADAVETLVALGELEQARAYLEPYELHSARLGSPWAVAAAARCRGLLAAAEGDRDGAFAAFERSLAELDGAPHPFERGRTLLSLGTVRRRAQQKRGAREALGQALAVFEELGARLWADRARAELRRVSGRPPAADGLTETERRVAALAGEGRSNKEIAAELFMGVSTVESHLSRVYRKLGVRRAGLARRLAAVPGDPEAAEEAVQA